MFCQCFFLFIYFLWPPYSPAKVNGGSRNFYTWWTLSVNREVTWIFSWSSLNYRAGSLQGWPKSDEIWQIFRSRPQTFCSHARTRQNIVILKKNLLSTVGCSTRRATVLWTLTYKPLRSTRHIKKYKTRNQYASPSEGNAIPAGPLSDSY